MKTEVRPSEKRAVGRYGVQDPTQGLSYQEDAKRFFEAYPFASAFGKGQLEAAAKSISPDWFVNAEGNPVELSNAEIARRYNEGISNLDSGEETPLQVFWSTLDNLWHVGTPLDVVNEINVAKGMFSKGNARLRVVLNALKLGQGQVRAELSDELQKELWNEISDIRTALELISKWTDKGIPSIGQAAYLVLGEGAMLGNGHQPQGTAGNGKKK